LNFLRNNDKLKRLEIQFNCFLQTNNLSFLSELIDIQSFNFDFNSIYFSTELEESIRKNLRLGNRLEYFFAYCILQSKDYDILAKNIQVVKDKITVGELDFIIHDNLNDHILHVEIANKFYLLDANIEGNYEQWIGPNRNDCLLKKIEKLKTKQFPLLHHNRTTEILSNLEINNKGINQQLLFKTQLFVPLENYSERKEERNIKGFYIAKLRFLKEDFKKNEYFIPEKQDWQVAPEYGEHWFSFNDALASINMFLAEKKSPLVWLKNEKGNFEKFFIIWW
jgi:hypothetical protein